jgi:hypothetical protein
MHASNWSSSLVSSTKPPAPSGLERRAEWRCECGLMLEPSNYPQNQRPFPSRPLSRPSAEKLSPFSPVLDPLANWVLALSCLYPLSALSGLTAVRATVEYRLDTSNRTLKRRTGSKEPPVLKPSLTALHLLRLHRTLGPSFPVKLPSDGVFRFRGCTSHILVLILTGATAFR